MTETEKLIIEEVKEMSKSADFYLITNSKSKRRYIEFPFFTGAVLKKIIKDTQNNEYFVEYPYSIDSSEEKEHRRINITNIINDTRRSNRRNYKRE